MNCISTSISVSFENSRVNPINTDWLTGMFWVRPSPCVDHRAIIIPNNKKISCSLNINNYYFYQQHSLWVYFNPGQMQQLCKGENLCLELLKKNPKPSGLHTPSGFYLAFLLACMDASGGSRFCFSVFALVLSLEFSSLAFRLTSCRDTANHRPKPIYTQYNWGLDLIFTSFFLKLENRTCPFILHLWGPFKVLK